MNRNKLIIFITTFFIITLLFGQMAMAVDVPDTGKSIKATDSSVDQSSNESVSGEQANVSVMQAFNSREVIDSKIVTIEDETKRLIMFSLGVPLLLLLIATVILGVAMGVYGKQVFIPHMVCAGLSLTLAMGHAVVGIVWFYPF